VHLSIGLDVQGERGESGVAHCVNAGDESAECGIIPELVNLQ